MCGAHLPWGMSLMIMKASLHTDHRMAGDVAKHQVALMTFHCKREGKGKTDINTKVSMYEHILLLR